MIKPKVFISYSWSNDAHQEHIKEIVERLAGDAVETVVDIYDLKEGDDKYHYMERMVTDTSVTHVLLICDKKYAEKANARLAGVGSETQIISQEIYSKVSQSKFIPLIFEYTSDGDACVPTFLASRIYIDFSTPEKENENWQRLIRLLYGQPENIKPALGKPPAYLEITSSQPSHHLSAKLFDLKTALANNKPSQHICRNAFLKSFFEYCDDLRIRESIVAGELANKAMMIHNDLLPARDFLIDWILMEGSYPSNAFNDSLLDLIEMLFELRSKPAEVNSWNEEWYVAHNIFSYEVFLYIVAALIKVENFTALRVIFNSSYLLPASDRRQGEEFATFSELYFYSDLLQNTLSSEGRRLKSPVAELVKRSATRTDITINDLTQADLVCLMSTSINLKNSWFPQMIYYSSHSAGYPLFLRATQKRGFKKLSQIVGLDDAEMMRDKLKVGLELAGANKWREFSFSKSFEDKMNADNWNTID